MNNRVPGAVELWRLARNAALIAVLAAVVGGAVNSRLLWKVFSGRSPAATPAPTEAGSQGTLPLPAELAEVRELLNSDTLLVDARLADLYAESHLPGARSLPRDATAEQMAAFRREVPPDRPLIVYCSGYGCEDSFLLAERLLAEGYRDVRVFEGGLPEWQDAGLPVEKEQP
jgi:rhodanese-related sulfurtransferase